MIHEITDTKEVKELTEFDNHHAVFLIENKEKGFKGYIAIHRKNPIIPSFGATRMWSYSSDAEALKDALRLSRMMSYKSALAGLKCGGGKGVIIADPHSSNKGELLREYARHVNILAGMFITGTDVGLSQEDLSILKKETPYIIGFNNNSTKFTARGIFESIKRVLGFLDFDSSFEGTSIAIQGIGKVGGTLLPLLEEAGCIDITVADIDEGRIKEIKEKYPHIKICAPSEIHTQDVDIFVPCALGGILNEETVAEMKCRAIVGGANNQLASPSVGKELFDKKILYAPDYIVNAGGLISVFDEYAHPVYDEQKLLKEVDKIEKTLSEIILISKKENKPTNYVASGFAEQIFNTYK